MIRMMRRIVKSEAAMTASGIRDPLHRNSFILKMRTNPRLPKVLPTGPIPLT
jgi:hypothetical protein